MSIDRVGIGQGAIAAFDHERAVAAVRELLLAIGEDPRA
jgi:GTP cyclohydrolase I